MHMSAYLGLWSITNPSWKADCSTLSPTLGGDYCFLHADSVRSTTKINEDLEQLRLIVNKLLRPPKFTFLQSLDNAPNISHSWPYIRSCVLIQAVLAFYKPAPDSYPQCAFLSNPFFWVPKTWFWGKNLSFILCYLPLLQSFALSFKPDWKNPALDQWISCSLRSYTRLYPVDQGS